MTLSIYVVGRWVDGSIVVSPRSTCFTDKQEAYKFLESLNLGEDFDVWEFEEVE